MVDWLTRRASPARVKTLKQHPRKNKTAINIEYMKASIRCQVETRFASSQRQFRLRGKPDSKGLLEKR